MLYFVSSKNRRYYKAPFVHLSTTVYPTQIIPVQSLELSENGIYILFVNKHITFFLVIDFLILPGKDIYSIDSFLNDEVK